ncbi:hypothetical protein Tco_1446916 [Tanacetum coccineum]
MPRPRGDTAEPSTPPTTTVIEDEDLIIAQTLMKMRSEKSKEKEKKKKKEDHKKNLVSLLLTTRDEGEKPKRLNTEKPLKEKDQIKFDEEVAKRLAEELEAD